jgi:ADP-ribosylglycohydrolase
MSDRRTLRRQLARLSLTGLSVGDAFGQQFVSQPELLATRTLPVYPWTFTDDTVMGIAVTQTLELCCEIDQHDLATRFGTFYDEDPYRGYGAIAHGILRGISNGEPWLKVSSAVFDSTGSMGNGAAMRAGPIGAYFYDDPEKTAQQAKLSAEITHIHPEGIAGAIAVAVAAAFACNWKVNEPDTKPPGLLQSTLPFVPAGEVKNGIELAGKLSADATVLEAAARLGCGKRILAQDTVPFCLWAAEKWLADFPEAMWSTASVFGDIDTNCAIVGSIVSLAEGKDGIPEEWVLSREPLNG